jgi:iron complex outermembrane receptor protein
MFAAVLGCILATVASAQTNTGRITGVVTNSSGNAFLEGATVIIEGTNRATTTDRRGEYDFGAMAPGDYSLRIAYTGMSSATARVTVVAGQSVATTTTLKEDAIIMGEFTVVTNRSADALAVTEQRNAPNIKNVVDIASYGMLNNDNPAELLQLLPGVMGSIAFNEVDRVSIRGVDASFNSVQLDGNSFATPSINDGAAANARSSVLSTTNTNNIKTAEVIKAITPDRPADAIGGIVNLIQRTALDYPKSAGRFEYRLGGQYVTTRSGYENRLTPNLQLTYHDVFGSNRNWGVYATAGFNKESTNQLRSTQNVAAANTAFGNVPNNNSTVENDRFRDRRNWALTIDHRPSHGHEFVFKYRHEDWLEATESLTTTFLQGTPAANWTPLVRALNLSSVQVSHGKNNPEVENNALSFDGKHRGDRWQLDYTAFYSNSIYKLYMNKEEDLGASFATILPTLRPNIVIDSTRDALFPSVQVTSANADAVYNPDNYFINLFQRQRPFSMNERTGFRADFKRQFDTALPFFLKSGVARTEQYKRQDGANNQRIFVGEDGVQGINPATGRSDDRLSRFVLPGPALLTGNDDVGNRRPFSLDVPAMNRSFRDQPQLWSVDPYGEFQRALQNDYTATETIDAAYLMGEASWRKFRVLTGVRWEETKVKGTGLLRDQPTASAAQVPDPYQRALINFGRPVTRRGSYDNFFPSVHTTYQIRANLQARASYSTGIARPGYNNLIPTTTIDDVNDVVTANSPGLKPQTADSYDLSLEYFSEPAGIISVGLFRKDIRDYITNSVSTVEPGNPFGEQYNGYRLNQPINAGSAKVQGIEFNVVQQLNFIPRSVGLFTLKGNLTLLKAEGNFGGTTRLASGEVPNFVPRAWNLVAEYAKGRFSLLARYNYQAGYLVGANANPNLATRNPDRDKLDVNFNYRWRREAHFFLAIDNVTEKPVYQQIGSGARLFTGNVWAASRRFNVGVQGKF